MKHRRLSLDEAVARARAVGIRVRRKWDGHYLFFLDGFRTVNVNNGRGNAPVPPARPGDQAGGGEPNVKATPIPPSDSPQLTLTQYRRMSGSQRIAALEKWLAENPRPAAPVRVRTASEPPPPPPPPKPPKAPKPPKPTPEEIARLDREHFEEVERVCSRCLAVMGLARYELCSDSRMSKVVKSREVVCAILRAYEWRGKCTPFPRIALACRGGTEKHATVLTALRRWSRLESQLVMAQRVAELAGIGGGMRLALARLHKETAEKQDKLIAKHEAVTFRQFSKTMLSAVGP